MLTHIRCKTRWSIPGFIHSALLLLDLYKRLGHGRRWAPHRPMVNVVPTAFPSALLWLRKKKKNYSFLPEDVLFETFICP